MKSSSRQTRSRRRAAAGWRAASIVLFLLVLALAAALILLLRPAALFPGERAGQPLSAASGKSKNAATHRFAFYVPNGEPIVIEAAEGETVTLPEGPAVDGYTFLGWLDSSGNPVTRETLLSEEDLAFSARYAVAFRDESGESSHTPYLSLEGDGFFRPDEPITKGELTELVYRLLAINGVGSGYFADVAQSDPLWNAAATLKDLGLIGGERLHPEDPVSYGELFSLLEKLFPAAREAHVFDGVPEGSEYYAAFCLAAEKGWLPDGAVSAHDAVPRKQIARIFNRLTGRSAPAELTLAQVGTILDMSPSDPCFADVAEAIIPHGCARGDGGECWSSSEPLKLRKAGLFFVGTELHCIKSDGSPAVGETVGGILYDEKGVASSGDAELDRLVRERLPEIVDPSGQTRGEMLELLYKYVLEESEYLRGEIYEIGQTGWEIEEAKKMLTSGKGNCYTWAATFWALSRAIGYDAVCYSGTVGTHGNPHGWVEIEFDGTPYIFDTVLQYEQWYGPGTHTYEYFYKVSYESESGWNYTREATP